MTLVKHLLECLNLPLNKGELFLLNASLNTVTLFFPTSLGMHRSTFQPGFDRRAFYHIFLS